jgi:hypothetical protein
MITLCMIGHIVGWKEETILQKIVVSIQCIILDCIYIIPLSL